MHSSIEGLVAPRHGVLQDVSPLVVVTSGRKSCHPRLDVLEGSVLYCESVDILFCHVRLVGNISTLQIVIYVLCELIPVVRTKHLGLLRQCLYESSPGRSN